MKKYVKLFLTVLCFLLSLGMNSTTAFAEETSGSYQIIIKKYAVEDTTILDNLPLNGQNLDATIAEEGLSLEVMAGVNYRITRVTPVQGEERFQDVTGEAAFSTTITTDNQGQASAINLTQGIYRVEELADSRIAAVMEPVFLELPLPQVNGEALSEVYLYPKSSIVEEGPNNLPDTEGNTVVTNQAGTKKLPQTSGNIGTALPLFYIIGFILLMGIMGLRSIQRKNQ